APRSRFAEMVTERARALAKSGRSVPAPGITLGPVRPYQTVTLDVNDASRTATLTVRGPETAQPDTHAGLLQAGDSTWALRAFRARGPRAAARDPDDAPHAVPFNPERGGLIIIKPRGPPPAVLAADRALARLQGESWLAREIVLKMARVLRRLDLTGKSLF